VVCSACMQAAGAEMSEAPVAGVSSPDTHGADGRVVYKVVLTGGTKEHRL